VFNRHLDTISAPDQPRMRIDADGRPYGMTTTNPQATFDDWTIGGRFTGHFLARPGHGRYAPSLISARTSFGTVT